MFSRGICCHYCGKRSKYTRGTTSFTCTTCEADNHLDASGDVLDYVPQHAQISAPAISSFAPQAPQGVQQPLFCKQCLQNQHIIQQMCADYLPDEADDSDYTDARYTRWKKNLETRYPPCCVDCESAAAAKLKKANYDAQCYQLALKIEKSQRGGSYMGVMKMEDSWKKSSQRMILRVAGILWWSSLLVQLLWHFMGVLAVPSQEDLAMEPEPLTAIGCARQVGSLAIDSRCASDFTVFLPNVLIAGLIVLWYHPALSIIAQPSLRKKRIEGMGDYLRMQLVTLALRAFAWLHFDSSSNTWNFSAAGLRAVHAFMIIFLFFINVYGHRVVRIDDRPYTFYDKAAPPLIDPAVRERSPPRRDDVHSQPSNMAAPSKFFQKKPATPFPIHILAPQSPKPYTPQTRKTMSPTGASYTTESGLHSPPVSDEMDDDMSIDAMDISYTPPAYTRNQRADTHYQTYRNTSVTNRVPIQPIQRKSASQILTEDRAKLEAKRAQEERRKQTSFTPNENSPFRGKLPPAPISPAHYLRNPPRQPIFKKTPLSQQQDFWQQMKLKSAVQTDVSGNPIGQPILMREDRQELALHDSGWRLPGDFLQDPDVSELGQLFGGQSFSLKEDVIEPAKAGFAVSWRLIALFGLVLAFGAWNVKAIRRPICLWLASKL